MTIHKIQFQTQGTCCALMNVVIEDNIIQDVEFLGGCMGNLAGIRNLVKGIQRYAHGRSHRKRACEDS